MSGKCAAGKGGRAAALAAVLALGLLLRLFVADRLFGTSFDTATVGLMGMHILEGERPLFYYGQDYMGALEAYAAALAFAVFGVSTLSLSLAPTAFALAWIAATYLLFAELYGHRGGLAAALTAAVPGWHALWHTLASNGGYPGALFFGTLSLWLALRLGRAAGAAERGRLAAALGVTVALGVWTSFLVAAAVVTGGAWLLATAWRRRDPRLAAALAAAAAVGALGLLPWLSVRAAWGAAGGKVTAFTLAGVAPAAAVLVSLLPQLVLWPTPLAPWLPAALALGALAAAAAALVPSIAVPAPGGDRYRRLLPLAVIPVFLALYLPNSLAQLPAPRYLIQPLALLLGASFAAAATAPGRWRRFAGTAALLVWTGFNGASALAHAREKTPQWEAERAGRERTVAAARRTGAGHIEIVGSPLEGLSGQVYSLYARERPRFVSGTEERWPPAALGADRDATTAFMFRERHLPRIERSLAAAGATCRTSAAAPWAFAYDVVAPRARRRALDRGGLSAVLDGAAPPGAAGAAALFDATAGTGIAGAGEGAAVTLTVRLARPATIDGVSVFAGDGARLPDGYRIEVSGDGERFVTAAGAYHDLLPASAQGNRVYLAGGHASQDLRFAPVTATAVRLRIEGGKPWRVDELRLFEHLGPDGPVAAEEIEAIAAALGGRGAVFAAADRWLSAQLAGRPPARGRAPAVYPRHNPRDPSSLLERRLVPRPGLALLPEQAFADETEALLREAAGNLTVTRQDFPHYALLAVGEGAAGAPAGALLWNGRLALREARGNGHGAGSQR